jgi:hypothetical protein
MSVSAPPTRQSPPCVHRAAPLAGLLVMALALALQLAAARPPAPLPLTAPEEAFSAARALALVERLLGDGAPHPTGSEANAAVRDRIIAELTALGYSAETQAAFSCSQIWPICGAVENVLARLPGERDRPAVMLTAHYDSVPAGPGAADDMAGVATVREIARILAAAPPPGNPVIFLLTDGEEPGLLGAEAFTAAHPWAASVGWSSTWKRAARAGRAFSSRRRAIIASSSPPSSTTLPGRSSARSTTRSTSSCPTTPI